MAYTDTSEKGLEKIIFDNLLANGYQAGDVKDYKREFAVDLVKLRDFLQATQPEIAKAFNLSEDTPTRYKFLARLQGEITKRGVIDVLRKGISHKNFSKINFYFGKPTPGNPTAAELHSKNIFSVTRQLRYSRENPNLSLDLCIFLNGLPVITFELKNSLTKQTYEDAIGQYKNDRDPRELLFKFGRCIVHFAVDDSQVWMCSELKGQKSWFLPFNKGFDDGAGNPPKADGGIKTDYLWKEILRRESLAEIIENYAQIVEEEDSEGGKKHKQIFPRYHQLDVVRELLGDAEKNGAGKRYLIQHSAGSGKSNSITWLAHQLVELKTGGNPIFDSIIVITDRRNLDKQIRENIKRFAQVAKVVGGTNKAKDLKNFLTAGKKIIITTVQKFPFVLDEIGNEHRGKKFALIIDEAHSSQGGRTMAQMHLALGENSADEAETIEDVINRIMESRQMLLNASYFAFTATPKNKTLEMFGEKFFAEGETKFRPFHEYTMKQAIEEGFILDVLQNYTPVQSYYRLIKTADDDPKLDVKKANKKLRRYVETQDKAIRHKAEIMVDHFHEEVLAKRKIGGKARAMICTTSIAQAVKYKLAVDEYLKERKSKYKAIVAFSGSHDVGGRELTESDMNKFPSSQIEKRFRQDEYRFLIVADKFQTGYDEPFLHTMYVDKVLAGVKAVQTLSRLNRAYPQKYDCFILDFANKTEVIEKAFEPYYRGTVLSEATDPNKLHDLKSDLDAKQIYSSEDVDEIVELFLSGANRDNSRFDLILDKCVHIYLGELDEDGQVDFKSKAKAFLRTYSFLATILTFTNADWEKLSIFLNFLVPKLPAPEEKDLAKGILQMIDMDTYRSEVQTQIEIKLPDKDGKLAPVPIGTVGGLSEMEFDLLSNILRDFNEMFGNLFSDSVETSRIIKEVIPLKVAANRKYQNAQKNSNKETAKLEHDRALQDTITGLVSNHTELFKVFMDNPSFKKWLSETIFALTYEGKQRKFGSMKGLVKNIADDFDAPLKDFEEYM